jgi:hypothetical protein
MTLTLLPSCKKVDSERSSQRSTQPSKLAIREIDFKNFVYPYTDSEPQEKWEHVDSKETVQLINGRHDFPGGAYLLFQSAAYGDLDGNGADEAAVDLIYGTGGTQNWHYLYVFEEKGGIAKLISRFASGSRAYGGLTGTEINSNQLLLDLQDSERARVACCSLGFIRVTYQLRNGSFHEIPPRIRDSFRTRVYPIYGQGPDSVQPSSDSNVLFVDVFGKKHLLTTSGRDSSPSLSVDGRSAVFVRNKTEVWTIQTDGSSERKVISCENPPETWTCDLPQFSPDSETIYVIREVEGKKGGVWKIDVKTGQTESLIPDSAQFLVITKGANVGRIVASQRTVSHNSSGADYAEYPFFLFTPDGTKSRKVGEDDAYIFDLPEALQR